MPMNALQASNGNIGECTEGVLGEHKTEKENDEYVKNPWTLIYSLKNSAVIAKIDNCNCNVLSAIWIPMKDD